MKVLIVASEAVPFAKTGGLADVIGSLPQALKKENVDVRVVIPKYEDISEDLKDKMTWKKSIKVSVGWRNQFCGIEELEHDGVQYYFIDNEYYFKRQGLYGYYDEAERFAFFCRGAIEMLPHIDFQPDIIHCHDWQTGMVSPFLKAHYAKHPFYSKIRTVFTIHNLKYQGIFCKEILEDLLSLGQEHFHTDGIEFNGCVSFIKGGINYSDILTTVSQTYAEEIQTSYFGENLDGLLRKRKDDLVGVLNGLDYNVYNPETDPNIFVPYNIHSLDKKKENKLKLQELLRLPKRKDIPLIAIVSRLVSQKGLDLIECVIKEILSLDIQLVVLGTGEYKYENMFTLEAYKNPEKVSVNILFNNQLAHRIYAASDMFLMPSLFEPCGLGQLIALRYGSIPIVRETGGLKDTITPFDEDTEEGNGFCFENYNAHSMLYAVKEAFKLYGNQELWDKLTMNAMNMDYSWSKSAGEYKKLYLSLIK
jgi:starch synthase